VTIFAIVWIIYCMDALKHPSLITTGQVWLLQATLEQVVFLGLLSCEPSSAPPLYCDADRAQTGWNGLQASHAFASPQAPPSPWP
jgi:hypothetical protein